MGIYGDNSIRDLTHVISYSDSILTNERCMLLCRKAGYKYSGTQNS